LIDEDAQRLLGYLYIYRSAHPNKIADRLNYETDEEVVDAVDSRLCKNKAGLVALRYTEQVNLHGKHLVELSITGDGREFVKEYKSDICAPFSVHTFVKRMEEIEDEIDQSIKNFVDRLDLYDENECSKEDVEEAMERIEDYFDDLRSTRL